MSLRLCETSAVAEGTPLRVEREGYPPLAVFQVGDRYFVTDDTCTHSEASLSDGDQEGTTIICPIHEGVFDIESGEAIEFPCTVPLQTYVATVRDGGVWIEGEIHGDD